MNTLPNCTLFDVECTILSESVQTLSPWQRVQGTQEMHDMHHHECEVCPDALIQQNDLLLYNDEESDQV